MQFSKKNLAIIGLVIILAATNVAFAVLYMTKNVNISGGVATVGAIEVYGADGVTPLLSYGFPLFTGGTYQVFTTDFFINNTGNVAVYVDWNISSSSITWTAWASGYGHMEDSVYKYDFSIYNPDLGDHWAPNDYTYPEYLWLSPGQGQRLQIYFTYYGSPNTPETFTLVMSFYAWDARIPE
jgi:fermentation-respiration switch protein FrsA (DUF1100 family)